MGFKKALLAVFTPLLLAQPIVAIAQTCAAVYATSTRNVDTYSRKETELNKLFSEHCESNGSMKSSSASVDLSVPIKAVKANFSGTKAEAAQEMQEFCKTRNDYFSKTSTVFSVNDSVVVEALNSLNQCLLIEGQKLYMSHTANTASLIIRGDYNPATENVVVQSVALPLGNGTCINTQTRKPIVSGTKPTQMNGPFSIECSRTGQKTKDGVKYPRFEVIVVTNRGNYPVTLLPEDVFNLDLASENKRALAKLDLLRANEANRYAVDKKKLDEMVTAEKAKSAALQTKLSNVTITKVVDYRQGDGEVLPCTHPANRPTPAEFYVQQCGADKVWHAPAPLQVGGDGRCGHNLYRLACIKVD